VLLCVYVCLHVLTFLSKSFAFLHNLETVISFSTLLHSVFRSHLQNVQQYTAFVVDVTVTKCADSRIRVEHMERQLANLTGLVQKALTQTPTPREYLQVPPPASARDANYRNGTYATCVNLFYVYPLYINK
jgi:hypothetical protein